MPYTLPNTISNGDAFDATPVQGNFSSIANEIVNIKAAQVTDQADIDALQAVMTAGGWVAETGTLAYAAADSPTFTATISGDQTTKYYPGIRVKGTQTQALSHYWTFNTNSAADVGSATMGNIGTPTYTAGKFGNALTLNGSDQALSITDAAAFKPTGEFTIGCWFKTANTGTLKMIFQSFAKSTNTAGIAIQITAGNVIQVYTSTNTGTAEYNTITGTTAVTDGNWHYVVWSCRNNYAQIYLDGKLEASGYIKTPAYHATSYPRIGVATENGTPTASTWFNGQIDDLFLINGYALDEQTIKAKYDAGTAQGTGDLTLTKYFLCTKSEYSAPNTTVTLYGGTDHALANATISNAYYSSQKAPYGFPLKKNKWEALVTFAGTNQATPAQNTWYDATSLVVPIGDWEVTALGESWITDDNVGAKIVRTALSRSASSATEVGLQVFAYGYGANDIGGSVYLSKYISQSAKTTWYAIQQSSEAATLGLHFNCLLRATSTLL